MNTRTCGHCGQPCWLWQDHYASINGTPVCFPQRKGRTPVNCYELVRIHRHLMPCMDCRYATTHRQEVA